MPTKGPGSPTNTFNPARSGKSSRSSAEPTDRSGRRTSFGLRKNRFRHRWIGISGLDRHRASPTAARSFRSNGVASSTMERELLATWARTSSTIRSGHWIWGCRRKSGSRKPIATRPARRRKPIPSPASSTTSSPQKESEVRSSSSGSTENTRFRDPRVFPVTRRCPTTAASTSGANTP